MEPRIQARSIEMGRGREGSTASASTGSPTSAGSASSSSSSSSSSSGTGSPGAISFARGAESEASEKDWPFSRAGEPRAEPEPGLTLSEKSHHPRAPRRPKPSSLESATLLDQALFEETPPCPSPGRSGRASASLRAGRDRTSAGNGPDPSSRPSRKPKATEPRSKMTHSGNRGSSTQGHSRDPRGAGSGRVGSGRGAGCSRGSGRSGPPTLSRSQSKKKTGPGAPRGRPEAQALLLSSYGHAPKGEGKGAGRRAKSLRLPGTPQAAAAGIAAVARQRESFSRQQEECSAQLERMRSLARSAFLSGPLHRGLNLGAAEGPIPGQSFKGGRATSEVYSAAASEAPLAERLRALNDPGVSGALQIELALASSQEKHSAGHSLGSVPGAAPPAAPAQKQHSLTFSLTHSLALSSRGGGAPAKHRPKNSRDTEKSRATCAAKGSGDRAQRGQRLDKRSLSIGAGGSSTLKAASLWARRAPDGARGPGAARGEGPLAEEVSERASLQVQNIPLSFRVCERREEEIEGAWGGKLGPGEDDRRTSLSLDPHSGGCQEAWSLWGPGHEEPSSERRPEEPQEASWGSGLHREGRPEAGTSLRLPLDRAVSCSVGSSMPRIHAQGAFGDGGLGGESEWGVGRSLRRGDVRWGIGAEEERGTGGCWRKEGEENGAGGGAEWGLGTRHQGVLPSAAKRRALAELRNRLHASDAGSDALPMGQLSRGQGRVVGAEKQELFTQASGEDEWGVGKATTRAPHFEPRERAWGSRVSPSLSPPGEWEEGVAQEGAQLGQSLREYVEAASKEHMSQSVFEAQLLLAQVAAEQEEEGGGTCGSGSGSGSGGGSCRQRERAQWPFPTSGSGNGRKRGKQTRFSALGHSWAHHASTGLADTYSSLKALGGAFQGWRVKKVVKSKFRF